jgi:hypothetical protein
MYFASGVPECQPESIAKNIHREKMVVIIEYGSLSWMHKFIVNPYFGPAWREIKPHSEPCCGRYLRCRQPFDVTPGLVN